MIHRRTLLALAVALALVADPSLAPVRAERPYIVVQSTTSTENSGLFDHILPLFTARIGIEVRVVAVGTGQALKNARNGDGDVLLVHAKADEEAFVAEGHGVERHDLMYNDFVIVGPKSDPAEIRGGRDAVVALDFLAAAAVPFASRGDDSGTHKKELELWDATAIDPRRVSGSWYRETGSGMGTTLNLAVGMKAYTMTDRATWIAFGNKGDFEIMIEGDERLFNQYGVTLVNPERHSSVKAKEGQAFIDWLTGPDGQQAIASYRRDGETLFFPNSKRKGSS